MVEFQWFFTALSVLWLQNEPFNGGAFSPTCTSINCELGDEEYLPSREQFCYLHPAVSKKAVSLVDDEVFLSSPWTFLHTGIEVVVPALSALFPQPALQVLGYHCPLLVAVEIHKLYNLWIVNMQYTINDTHILNSY